MQVVWCSYSLEYSGRTLVTQIAINPDQVTHVKAYGEENNKTEIFFNNMSVTVDGEVSAVVAKLTGQQT